MSKEWIENTRMNKWKRCSYEPCSKTGSIHKKPLKYDRTNKQ